MEDRLASGGRRQLGSDWSHLWLVADDQLVVHGRREGVHDESETRPVLHPDQALSGPGDRPPCCPLTGKDLQRVAWVQRDAAAL